MDDRPASPTHPRFDLARLLREVRERILATSEWAAPLCRGWRWLPSTVAVGTAPFAASYAMRVAGHQIVSSVLLSLLCLNCVRRDTWIKGVAIIAVAFAAHSIAVIAVSRVDPQTAAPLLPGATTYWEKQMTWITTGEDPEYELRNWVPQHALLLVAVTLFSFTSAGVLGFYVGFLQVDLMNYYNAQLLGRSA